MHKPFKTIHQLHAIAVPEIICLWYKFLWSVLSLYLLVRFSSKWRRNGWADPAGYL